MTYVIIQSKYVCLLEFENYNLRGHCVLCYMYIVCIYCAISYMKGGRKQIKDI